MVLANVLMWSGTDFYPRYAASAEELGISPVADQSTAGPILMAWCTVLALSLLAWVFLCAGHARTSGAALRERIERADNDSTH